MSSAEELQTRVDSLPWYHTLDLGNGVVTNGACKTFLADDQLPAFEGKSVLDIGAWDGYYSFLAERQGAARVVALDDYVWGVDFAKRNPYWAECHDKGILPDHTLDRTEFWNPDLPGRRSFDLAREAYGSRVEGIAGSFLTAAEHLGSFDIVLFLGVLYHVRDPLGSLEAIQRLTREVAVIETEALFMPDRPGWSALEFHAGCYRGLDYGNWFTPTIDGIHELCMAAGFSKVVTVKGPPAVLPPIEGSQPEPVPAVPAGRWQFGARRIRDGLGRRLHYAVHGREPASPPGPELPNNAPRHFRALVHAFV